MSKPAIMPTIKPPEWPADQVEKRKIEELHEYARNARTHSDAQVSQIAASISEWGFTQPIIVDEKNMILAGHGRYYAARKLLLKEVPVVVARGWSEPKKRAYILADNKLALNAGYDNEMLALELHELNSVDFPLALTGFGEEELSSFLAPLDSEGYTEAAAEAPEDFNSYDETIETEHQCPKCGYAWSGKPG